MWSHSWLTRLFDKQFLLHADDLCDHIATTVSALSEYNLNGHFVHAIFCNHYTMYTHYSVSANYRGITLSVHLSKVFKMCILELYSD